jgi:hypothetical protein
MRVIYQSGGKAGALVCATAAIALNLLPVNAAEDVDEVRRKQFGKRADQRDTERKKIQGTRSLEEKPVVIDVSGYPLQMQKIYNGVYSQKCSQCHSLALSLNSRYALPEEWMKCVKEMVKNPESNIDPISAEKIYTFLVYDSGIRKKELIARKKDSQRETLVKGGGMDSPNP